MIGRLAGKVALVTGGASGLGEAIAHRFATEGARVVIADIDKAGGEALAAALDNGLFVPLDVTKEDEWIAAFAAVDERYGRLDILVNNAGITTIGSIETLEVDAFRTMLEIDLVGVFLGCKHVVPLMRRSGAGSVINMSSMCGVRGDADLVGYNAAKAGVTLLTKSVALHYARLGEGMRCNSVHPGATHTPILDKVMAQSADPKALYDGWVSGHPIGRLGKPEEIAALCVYLATDESAFATGGTFVVDGGSSL